MRQSPIAAESGAPHVGLAIRFATAADVGLILGFIRALAVYEKLEQHVTADEETLGASLFGARPAAECLIAALDGKPVGFALFFENFSTFRGRRGMYLEDLFVEPEARGQGVGRALFQRLASIAVERAYCRIDWAVLDWNEPAKGFYQQLGAIALDEWTVNRLQGAALDGIAQDGDCRDGVVEHSVGEGD